MCERGERTLPLTVEVHADEGDRRPGPEQLDAQRIGSAGRKPIEESLSIVGTAQTRGRRPVAGRRDLDVCRTDSRDREHRLDHRAIMPVGWPGALRYEML